MTRGGRPRRERSLPDPRRRTAVSNGAVAQTLSRLLGGLLSVYRATLRVRFLHRERYGELRDRGVPILFALWHGRMFLSIQVHRGEGIVTMASQSKDGEIIALWLERNGYRAARGSSSRGGGPALREMVRAIRSGRHAALTVDGPRGPARVVQAGVVELARLTGAWILPISFSSARPRFLRSWDRYLLPLPFSRNVVAYGEPFPIPRETAPEEAQRRIAEALDETTRAADEAAGIDPPAAWRDPLR
ncbi:MAG TPA: lysophospholipid acyltransferase family protein [Thermoanaerobaculia bacterium]|nr:lysophospholipid acyltransferase family protein [Thermoanaerobaculia bacterium]